MSTALKKDTRLLLMLLPAAVFFLAFFLLPMLRLFVIGGQGAQVLDGQVLVRSIEGADVSAAFIAGAQLAERLVQQHGIRIAVLKARSPSCGNRHSYDGSFSGNLVAGEGVTAAALRRLGVQVFNESELQEAAQALRLLE